MASPWPHILRRDGDSGTGSKLTAGVIAGISCGAAALFLGAVGLFILYWRRQRRYDRRDNFYRAGYDRPGPHREMAPAVTYTMDYKIDRQRRESNLGSSYTHSPEKPAYPFCPLGSADTASAMPTHPAYIPQAFIRAKSTPSNRSTVSPVPSTAQFPSPGAASSKSQPNEAGTQAYLTVAAPGSASPVLPLSDSAFQSQDKLKDTNTDAAAEPAVTQEHEPDSSLAGGRPAHPSKQLPPIQAPAQILPAHASPPLSISSSTTATSSGGRARLGNSNHNKKTRKYVPPRLNLLSSSFNPSQPEGGGGSDSGRPPQGRENNMATISGPLAFPEHHPHYHHPQQHAAASAAVWTGYNEEEVEEADTRQPFRSRVLGWSQHRGAKASGNKGSGGKKDKDKGAGVAGSGGGKWNGQNNRHYAEIEIGRGSDIW